MVRLIPSAHRSHHRDEAGVLAVIVAVAALMIFGLAALVVDLGLARDVRRQSQNAIDASALAGGNALYEVGLTPHFTESVDAVKAYAADNFDVDPAAWSACSDATPLPYQPGGTSCISFDEAAQPRELRVVMPEREVATGLGSLFGTSSVQISSLAHIRIEPNQRSRCGMCVVGNGNHDLQNGDVVVSGGDIHFNGNVAVGPNGLVSTDGDITVEGTAGGAAVNYNPSPQTGQPEEDDPLRFLEPPDYSALVPRANPCTGGPGIYGAFGGTCTLTPGLYVITGEWRFTGNAGVIGDGVTLYFTCGTPAAPRPCADTGEAGGKLDASGNGTIRIVAPATGPLKGLAIFYDRSNTQSLRLTGNGASYYSGTVYAISATLDYRGNGCGSTHESLMVAHSLAFSGTNACLTTNYDLARNVDMPPGDLHLSR